jgi:adenosylcobinamide-GDP ribazoletransferase
VCVGAVAAELWRDITAACGVLTCLPVPRGGASRSRLARSTLFFPVIGAVLGAILVVCERATAGSLPNVARCLVVVGLLIGLAGARTLRALSQAASGARAHHPVPAGTPSVAGVAAVTLVTSGKVLALAVIAPPLSTAALMLAPVLGRWAVVVLAYGAKPIRAGSDNRFIVTMGRVTFREFGWASVMAFAISFSVAEALGLIAVVAAAVLATALRLLAHRWFGGVSGDMLGAAVELVEAVVLATIAVLSEILM